MSEQFESGLNELYTRAAAAHASSTGFPTTALVTTARRHRRVRATAVSMATVAAVVGVGLGGAAAVRTFGDGASVAPAVSVTPDPNDVPMDVTLTCGTVMDAVPWSGDTALTIEGDLGTPAVPGAGPLPGSMVITGVGASNLTADGALALQYLAVQDGVVVGIGRDTGAAPVVGLSGRDGVAHEFTVAWTGCDADGQTTDGLTAGEYQLYVSVTASTAPVTAVDDQGTPTDLAIAETLLLGGPWSFTVTTEDPAAPTATPGATEPPETLGANGVSATFTEGAPLADGDYFGQLLDIDPTGASIQVDLEVWYSGQAAEDYVAANVPGGEYTNDYYLVNDVEQATTLPLDPGVTVFEWCFGESDTPALTYLPRTVDQWVTAPEYDGVESHLSCSDGQQLDRGVLYWLRVRDGVVTAVTGQFVP